MNILSPEKRRELEPLLATLKPAAQLRFSAIIGKARHWILVMLTDQRGIDTGRPRYLVACTSCMALLHEATTGPLAQVDFHAREIGRPS